MKPLLLSLDGNEALAAELERGLGAERGEMANRRFPDGESYVRVLSPCEGRDVILVQTLFQPDEKVVPIIFLVETLREMGARSVGLVAPYLAYMRQDIRFKEGEGVTSRYFARLLSSYFDWLVTVDPHLHRYSSLDEIYTIPSRTLQAAPVIAEWISRNVPKPLLIGPDSESEQWVSAVAGLAGAPFTVLTKTRHGDRDVEVTIPQVDHWYDHVPVLVDDIISSGHTLMETMTHLQRLGLPPAVCIAVHGVFAEGAHEALLKQGASRVVTVNTISHESNAIDVGPVIVRAVSEILSGITN